MDVNELDECRIWAQNQELLEQSRAGTEFGDEEMADENTALDEEQAAGDMDEEDMVTGAQEPGDRQFEGGDNPQVREVTQRRKPSRRKNHQNSSSAGASAHHGGGLVNGEGTGGGTAVRVGDGG